MSTVISFVYNVSYYYTFYIMYFAV